MIDAVTKAIIAFNWVVIGYAAILALAQLMVLAMAASHIVRALRRDAQGRQDDVFSHPQTPAVSVLVPAFNEERTVVESVRSILALHYPELEAIVVDDGSTDGTFDRLQEAFDLVEVPRAMSAQLPVRGAVISTHVARNGDPLLVIRKANAGRCADALNVALNAARTPLVCMVDADSVIEPDALLHVVRPFVEDPERVVAAGGVIRPSNGISLRRGSVGSVVAPATLLGRAQAVEYLRAFLIGRVGWTSLQGILIISGAFGVFRRADVLAVGGMSSNSLGQDAELVADLHRSLRERNADYRMVMVPQPVCWTEVPELRRDLARQRRRWSHGLAQVLWRHRRAFARSRYGRFGLLVLPYHLVFEMLGPLIEILGVPAILAAWGLGLLNAEFALVAYVMSLGFGLALSLAAVLFDEMTFHRFERWRDVGRLVVAALIESTVLRWWHSWWRVRGLLDAVTPRHTGWGELTRVGFRSDH